MALEFMLIPHGIVETHWHWPVRYVMLLWLYIICLIPFDLAQFDETDQIGQTAKTLESVAKTYIGAAGLEKEAAALLLSRLYIRYVSHSSISLTLNQFVQKGYWCRIP